MNGPVIAVDRIKCDGRGLCPTLALALGAGQKGR